MTTLEIRNLSVSYGGRAVVRNANLKVDGGCLCALFGPNGSGKSTVIKALCNLVDFSGEALIQGRSVKSAPPRELSRLLSHVPQSHSFAYGYRAVEVVMMGDKDYLSLAADRRMRRAAEKRLDEMGILPLRDRRVTELSGGEKQLVQIARALNQRAPALLLDEPTGGLDFGNQRALWEQLRRLKRNKTIIVSSHDPNHIIWFCDFVVVMNEGEMSEKKSASRLGLNDIRNLYPGEWAVAGQNASQCILPGFANRGGESGRDSFHTPSAQNLRNPPMSV